MYDNRMDAEYLEMKVLTASPAQLHLLILEGAIRHARQAREALVSQDWEASFDLLNRSREFVSELLGGLKDDQAPEMVESLKQLFTFAYRNLALADLEREPTRVDSALRVLELHRETWLELLTQLPATTATLNGPHISTSQDAPPLTKLDWEG